MKFKIPSIFKNIYVLILLLFAIWMVFFDSNSTLVHLELNEQINELKKETEYYKNEIENVQQKWLQLYEQLIAKQS